MNIAEIAQLVEHNLAKVGVASSSLVFRSIRQSVALSVSRGMQVRVLFWALCCGNSSVGRAQPCQGWGREFESRFPLIASRIFHDAEIAQLVEHNLAKVRVASSSLVFRSVNLLRGQLHWFLFFCVFFFLLFSDFILC